MQINHTYCSVRSFIANNSFSFHQWDVWTDGCRKGASASFLSWWWRARESMKAIEAYYLLWEVDVSLSPFFITMLNSETTQATYMYNQHVGNGRKKFRKTALKISKRNKERTSTIHNIQLETFLKRTRCPCSILYRSLRFVCL